MDTLPEPDDAELMADIRKGSHMAFNALVRRHSNRFYRLAYRYTRNRQTAEDRVQDAFLKLWEDPSRWKQERNVKFTTWFYRVVVNLCLDTMKRTTPLQMAEGFEPEDERDGVDIAMQNARDEQWLEQSIATLPERQRTALNLCVYEELSNQEAADIMGVQLKALQSLLMRAKTTL